MVRGCSVCVGGPPHPSEEGSRGTNFGSRGLDLSAETGSFSADAPPS